MDVEQRVEPVAERESQNLRVLLRAEGEVHAGMQRPGVGSPLLADVLGVRGICQRQTAPK